MDTRWPQGDRRAGCRTGRRLASPHGGDWLALSAAEDRPDDARQGLPTRFGSGSPSVAVCIPTYNQAQFLAHAVESALHQADYSQIEVWVSDDASTDDTASVMTTLCARDSRVHYHRHEKTLGIAENSSWVLSRPTADVVVRLDSDDVLLPDYVRTLHARLMAYPEAGYAHSSVAVIDANDVVQSISHMHRSREYVPADAALRQALKGYKTVANILMFRAEALRRANYYHGRPSFAEDYDLSVRLADLGYGNVYVSDVLAQYRVWGDAQGLRHHRKALHLQGLTALFHVSFVAAFERRGWNLAEVRRARSRIAVRFATSIFMPWISDDERADLLPLLYRLDGGFRVHWRVFLLKLGLAPVFAALARLETQFRRLAKRSLALLGARRLAPRPP